jgi:hypothetical protein
MVNMINAKLKTFVLVLAAAVGLIATVITSQVRMLAVEPLPPYSATTHGSTSIGNGHYCSSDATVYLAQEVPTPTPDATGGGVPLKS